MDAELYWPSENQRRAKYRRLQSRYRETILKVEAGTDRLGRKVGSLLPEAESKKREGLNFVEPSVTEYVKQRVDVVHGQGGTIESGRLWRNMLSSMPLCFNLFGFLRRHPEIASRALSGALGLDLDRIDQIEVEWAPQPPTDYLGDKTAFDAWITYETSTGKKGFVGIETKYVDSFGRQKLNPENLKRYAKVAQETKALVEDGKPDFGHQVWRNTLLALAVLRRGKYEEGYSAVLSLSDDFAALKEIAQMRARLKSPQFLRWAPFEGLIAELALTELAGWANKFRTRYLDLNSEERESQ